MKHTQSQPTCSLGVCGPYAHSASRTVRKASLLLFSISLSVYSLLPLSLLIPSAFYTAYHITSHHIISKLTGNCNEPRSDSIKMKPFSGAFVKRSIAHNTNTHTAQYIYSTNTHSHIWHSTHSFCPIFWLFFPGCRRSRGQALMHLTCRIAQFEIYCAANVAIVCCCCCCCWLLLVVACCCQSASTLNFCRWHAIAAPHRATQRSCQCVNTHTHWHKLSSCFMQRILGALLHVACREWKREAE